MNARDYYNEFDPYAAQWLRNLIAEGLIPPGYVDERSIVDVRPDDLRGFRRCHFFAGLGGWPFALAVAGWPEDFPVWTGSCPCQPFSVSGKRKGFADERHLWPIFRGLIEVGRPPVLFGEQVARAPEWLNLVRGDLVEMGYAVGAIPMEAASADADHFRDRYWFVADRDAGQREHAIKPLCPGRDATVYDGYGDLAHLPGERGREGQPDPHDSARPPSNVADRTSGGNRTLANGHGQRSQIPFGQSGDVGKELATAAGDGVRTLVNRPGPGWGEGWTEHEFRLRGFTASVASIDGCQYLECPDGKWRRLPPPGVRWLGTRIPARVDKLRAIGNAIDHRPAAQFIGGYLDTRGL